LEDILYAVGYVIARPSDPATAGAPGRLVDVEFPASIVFDIPFLDFGAEFCCKSAQRRLEVWLWFARRDGWIAIPCQGIFGRGELAPCLDVAVSPANAWVPEGNP